jgi:simple sugar transport system ATP-binding protein
MSVQENMALGDVAKYIRQRGFSIDWKSVRADIDQAFTSLGLKSPAFDVASGTLSGGNLQRTILARELSRHPKLIIAFYPTRGMDVPSATAARDLLVAARDAGAGVLLISEDLEELFSFSDRLIVLYRGQIVGSFKPQETTMESVGHLMTGSRGEDGQD